MKDITIYDSTSGRILRTLHCQDADIDLNVGPGENYVEGIYIDSDYWINSGSPSLKQAPSISLDTLSTTVGSNITVTGAIGFELGVTGDAVLSEVVANDPETISFDGTGSYTLAFSKFPYLDAVFEVTVS